jgi:hypothetical protein
MATAAAHHLGSNALLASKTFQGGTQYAPLPADQWRAEMGRWFAVTLALLQQGFVGFVAGGSDDITRQAGVKATTLLDPGQIVFCQKQRVRNAAGVQNFGFVAVLVVVCVGMAIVVVGLGLDTVVGWAQARRGDGDGRRRRWSLDGLFQLHRMAYEAVEQRRWVGLDGDIPTTVGAFAPLSEVDPMDIFIESHAEPSLGLEMESNPNEAAC